MKRFIAGLMLVSLMVFVPATAHAHTLKTDGNIGITIHIDPDDEPIPGKDSAVFVTAQDRSGALEKSNCTCTITLLKNDKVLSTTNFTLTGSSGSGSVNFPEAGVYTVGIAGTGDGFQAFKTAFVYNIKGSGMSGAETEEATHSLRTYVPFVVIGVACFIVMLFSGTPQKKSKKK